MQKYAVTFGLTTLILAVLVFAASTQNSPTSCSGQWSSCSNAFADGGTQATTTSSGKTSTWSNYGFSLSGSTIDSVTVRADFWATRTNGYIDVQVSNGTAWGPKHRVGGNTAEQTFNIDVTNDLVWTPTGLSNANFKVNVSSVKVGGGPTPTWKLDWVPVTVNYTVICTRANPAVLISPDSQSATAGSTLTYNTTVTNNDSNGCGSSTFAMSYSIPSGWTGSFNNNTLTISPGQSQSTTFSITSSVNATLGNYTFTNTATNNNAPSYSGSDTAEYVVV